MEWKMKKDVLIGDIRNAIRSGRLKVDVVDWDIFLINTETKERVQIGRINLVGKYAEVELFE